MYARLSRSDTCQTSTLASSEPVSSSCDCCGATSRHVTAAVCPENRKRKKKRRRRAEVDEAWLARASNGACPPCPCPTLVCVLQRIAHYVPLLHITRIGGQNQMLLRWGQTDGTYHPSASDSHGAYLWGQRCGQPAGEGHQQRHSIAIAPGCGRAYGHAQQRVIIVIVLPYRTQPGD